MKPLLLLIALSLPVAAMAQDADIKDQAAAGAARTANQRFGWFHSEAWAQSKMLSKPGWRVHNQGTTTEEGQFILFVANDYSQAVNVYFYKGTVSALTFLFGANGVAAQNETLFLDGMEAVGKNEWVSRSNNARVKRLYNGQFIEYHVDYEPLAGE